MKNQARHFKYGCDIGAISARKTPPLNGAPYRNPSVLLFPSIFQNLALRSFFLWFPRVSLSIAISFLRRPSQTCLTSCLRLRKAEPYLLPDTQELFLLYCSLFSIFRAFFIGLVNLYFFLFFVLLIRAEKVWGRRKDNVGQNLFPDLICRSSSKRPFRASSGLLSKQAQERTKKKMSRLRCFPFVFLYFC